MKQYTQYMEAFLRAPNQLSDVVTLYKNEGWEFVSIISRPKMEILSLGSHSIDMVTGIDNYVLLGRTELGNALYEIYRENQ